MTVREKYKSRYNVTEDLLKSALYMLFENYGREKNKKMISSYKELYQSGVITNKDIKLDNIHIDVNDNSHHQMTFAECYYTYVIDNITKDSIETAISFSKYYGTIKKHFQPLIELAEQENIKLFVQKNEAILDQVCYKLSYKEEVLLQLTAALYLYNKDIVCPFMINVFNLVNGNLHIDFRDEVESFYHLPQGSLFQSEDYDILRKKLVKKIERLSGLTEEELIDCIASITYSDDIASKHLSTYFLFNMSEGDFEWDSKDVDIKNVKKAFEKTIQRFILTAYLNRKEQLETSPNEPDVDTQHPITSTLSGNNKIKGVKSVEMATFSEMIKSHNTVSGYITRRNQYTDTDLNREGVIKTLTSNIENVDMFISEVVMQVYVDMLMPYLKFISKNKFIQILSDSNHESDYRESSDDITQKYDEMVSINKVLSQKVSTLNRQIKKLQTEKVKEPAQSGKSDNELIELNQKYNKLQKEYESLQEQLKNTKSDNDILNEMLQQLKERNNTENYDIDTEKRYVFIAMHDAMVKRITVWFPNSKIIEKSTDINYKTIQNADAVIAMVTNVKHPDYYGVKNLCKKHNVPFIHCNKHSFNEICKVIYECTQK